MKQKKAIFKMLLKVFFSPRRRCDDGMAFLTFALAFHKRPIEICANIISDTDFHENCCGPARLPYKQFIKIMNLILRLFIFFGIIGAHKTKFPREREEKTPTKDSSEILLLFFTSSFPSFLCLLRHISRTQSAPRQRTNKNIKNIFPAIHA